MARRRRGAPEVAGGAAGAVRGVGVGVATLAGRTEAGTTEGPLR